MITAKRLFFGLLILLVVLIGGLFAATYSITGLIKAQSTQLAADKAQVNQLTAQQAGLAKSKRDIARYQPLETITKAIVPQDKDQAQAVREITKIAAANKVPLTTITFPNSSLGGAAAAKTSNLSQLVTVPNIPGVYNLQITLGNNSNNTITFAQLDAFLRSLENNRRTAAVSSISIQPQQNNSTRLVFNLVINAYIKPS